MSRYFVWPYYGHPKDARNVLAGSETEAAERWAAIEDLAGLGPYLCAGQSTRLCVQLDAIPMGDIEVFEVRGWTVPAYNAARIATMVGKPPSDQRTSQTGGESQG